MSATLLTVDNVDKTFEDRDASLIALSGINLDVRAGEFLILVGPSGSGKSTLLRIMSGLEKEYGGDVVYHDDLTHRDMSFVFQQFALLPWLTVFENVELGLIARDVPVFERKGRVHAELKRLGLEQFAHTRPVDLSGGMRQRVGIARALVTKPKIMFMDEPFSELDSFTAEELRQEILRIWEEQKLTIVMVTHIIEDAVELGDRIAVLTSRPGHIEKIVENPLPRPRQKRTSDFYAIQDHIYRLIKP